MADIGQTVVDQGSQMGAGLAARTILGRSVPLPDFYNPNSPNHFSDSEAGQMLHGNGRAWRRFGGRTGGRMAGAAIGNMLLPGLGGLLGGMAGGWLGGRIFGGDNAPVGTVGGSPATVTPDRTSADGISIDPWTGQQISGLPNYMPDFTGGAGYSNYGPYAGGYQGLPDDSDGGSGVLPDFSNYSDQFTQLADEDGNGKISHQERKDASSGGYGYALPMGVTNFMVGGFPVINGVRPAGGDMNQAAVYNPRRLGD